MEAQLRRVSALAAACQEAMCYASSNLDVTVENSAARGRGCAHDPVPPGPPDHRMAGLPHAAAFASSPSVHAIAPGSRRVDQRDILSALKRYQCGEYTGWCTPHAPPAPAHNAESGSSNTPSAYHSSGKLTNHTRALHVGSPSQVPHTAPGPSPQPTSFMAPPYQLTLAPLHTPQPGPGPTTPHHQPPMQLHLARRALCQTTSSTPAAPPPPPRLRLCCPPPWRRVCDSCTRGAQSWWSSCHQVCNTPVTHVTAFRCAVVPYVINAVTQRGAP